MGKHASLSKKIQIILEFETHDLSIREIGRLHTISKETIRNWILNKQRIFQKARYLGKWDLKFPYQNRKRSCSGCRTQRLKGMMTNL